jgi:hypothetical protein
VRGEAYTGFWWGNLRERDRLEEPGVDGRIILGWIFRKWDVGAMDWIELAQHSDRCRALVNAVMNFRVPYMRGISGLAENWLASQEGLRSMV